MNVKNLSVYPTLAPAVSLVKTGTPPNSFRPTPDSPLVP